VLLGYINGVALIVMHPARQAPGVDVDHATSSPSSVVVEAGDVGRL
jgi:hypothetical protein